MDQSFLGRLGEESLFELKDKEFWGIVLLC